MPVLLNLNKKYFTFLFFMLFFFTGIFVFSDYGMSIDEDNTRVVGFLSLKSIFKIFIPEYLEKINYIISAELPFHPDIDMIPSSGVAFDLPMALLEFIFQIEDSRSYYLLRHFFTFFGNFYFVITD